MEILFLSSKCSRREYERMFRKYGTTLSHAGQKFYSMLLKGFQENGCSVYALSRRIVEKDGKDDLHRPPETEDGISYTYLPRCSNKKLNRLLAIYTGFKEICKWHREHPEGVIVCDILVGELSIALCLARILHRIKTTALVTDVPSIRAGDTRTGIRAIPVKLKNSLIYSYDSYIFLTEQMNKVLNPKSKPYVIMEGIVDQGVLDQANTLEQKYPEKVCIMAGLLEDIYGVDTLLHAFQQIHCPEARLFFYGRGDGVAKILEVSAKDSRISYKGELTNAEIVKEEKKATLLINPRPPIGEWTAYSFPSKNMEYIASGTPMLAYNLPCIPAEYLPHFFCVEAGDGEHAFENKLAEILKMDASELHAFGLSSQEWIVREKNGRKQTEKAVHMIISLK